MARKTLSKSDINTWNKKIQENYSIEDFLDKKEKIEIEDEKFIVINNEKAFFLENEKIIPTLKFLQKKNILKKVTVDMGAVKFVVNGADIMRPGIVLLEERIMKDSYVVIVDEKNKKPLSVGKMLFTGEEVSLMKTGKVIKNIHWIGDDLWKS